MKIDITVMSGAGNVFSVIDGKNYNFSIDDYSKIAQIVCSANTEYNKKTEGLLVVIPSIGDTKADFEVWFFNPDGTHSAMCGNGARCAVHFAMENGFINFTSRKNILFNMQGNDYRCLIIDSQYQIYFPSPEKIDLNKEIFINNSSIIGDYINVGSDHFVIDYERYFEQDFFEFDINAFAPSIRNNEAFAPNGVNVNIYKIIDNKIYVRTFERGVEWETGACGTGAISTAISLVLNQNILTPIELIPHSKIPLVVSFNLNIKLEICGLYLKGPAEILTKYSLDIPSIL